MSTNTMSAAMRATMNGLEAEGFLYAGLRRPDGTREEYEEETTFSTYYSPVSAEAVQVRRVDDTVQVVKCRPVTLAECKANGWIHCGRKAVAS